MVFKLIPHRLTKNRAHHAQVVKSPKAVKKINELPKSLKLKLFETPHLRFQKHD